MREYDSFDIRPADTTTPTPKPKSAWRSFDGHEITEAEAKGKVPSPSSILRATGNESRITPDLQDMEDQAKRHVRKSQTEDRAAERREWRDDFTLAPTGQRTSMRR